MTETDPGETNAPAPELPSAPGPELFCPACGYNLRGIAAAVRCPECGLEIDREGFARPQIPWVYRRQIGRLRGYWRTVWLATWRPAVLAAESVKAVDCRDAQRFRLVTSILAAAGLAACFGAATAAWGSTGFVSLLTPGVFQGMLFGGTRVGKPGAWLLDVFVPWEAGATYPPVVPLATFVTLVLVSGVASYWFHPRDLPVVRQNWAVAISYYACAPLVFLPLPAAALTAAVLMRDAGLAEPTEIWGPFINVLAFLGVIAAVVWAGALWRATLTVLSRATHPPVGRLAAAAVLIPLSWLACLVLAMGVLPWVLGFLRLFFGSLRA